MRTEHSFSALDHHAVLGGSDDGLPWYASSMLALEAGEVVCLRLEKFAGGDRDCEHEAQLMVMEKIAAAFEAGANWFKGATAGSFIGRCHEHVANPSGSLPPDPAARCSHQLGSRWLLEPFRIHQKVISSWPLREAAIAERRSSR